MQCSVATGCNISSKAKRDRGYVVVEVESNVRALQLNLNFTRGNVLEMRRDYHLFDYCCNVREDRILVKF